MTSLSGRPVKIISAPETPLKGYERADLRVTNLAHADKACRPFLWDLNAVNFARQLACGYSYRRAARLVGLSYTLALSYGQHPEFQDHVRTMREEAAKRALEEGIGLRLARLRRLNDHWESLQDVIESRQHHARAPENRELLQNAPGLETGLVTATIKSIGGGPGMPSERVIESEIDVPLLKELRDIERQAAQELGQWQERSELTIIPKTYIGIDLDRV